ncbi:uncharacterized protein TRIVIDRAFT_215807 [Trichoderma virens Gv29-8]|uniref:Uncharacterized protein n=1 Tax=Hypocrea virens (strain Gv29-8 / FGSC 10586) TaxID=413071 RepID=G9MNL1_HYPVG|nr:uncharacterized protein TRIVIDRAFT_215807 [Trichoderma virens Gv29-8]EHK23467.1 hypothetical protein TRIVIDRAFT_215807 [Trichoderma virens Gv29-8]
MQSKSENPCRSTHVSGTQLSGCSELYGTRRHSYHFCTAPNHDAKWGVGACAKEPHPVVEPHAI